jgi:Cys-tRNA(Pro)/Cys-tRNA(Cys) deacylase
METTQSAAIDYLNSKGIDIQIFQHPAPVLSIDQAARERGQQPGQVVRSILFRLPDDIFLMVLIAGPRQVNWQQFRKLLNTHRVTLATPEEVFEVTGYHIGTVSPFGLPHKIRLLVDQRLQEREEISIGSGIPGVAIIMKTVDLLELLEPIEWVII